MTAFKVWTWHFNLFVAATLLSNWTPRVNVHKTNPRFYVTWILINLYISLYMEGHLVLASRGIIFYCAWIFLTKKYTISNIMNIHPYLTRGESRGGAQGGQGPPYFLIFRSNWGPKCRKNCFGDHPSPSSLSKGLDDLPPIITRSGSGTANTFNLIIFKRPLISSTIYGAINVTEVRIKVIEIKSTKL